ncbi:NAD-dependent aldehyde dehydrogenase family protein [Medicago truncatula]|uniref:NAD-dependent aldehyde dehydrogenase family protein n=1 Tax=Medicago truncatula TaxID=3880 RepID=G7JSC5_MEDTR|nr:NAD-dependent aldehyde dehydrogenase family protein [Medicago truncatula]
MNKVHMVNDTFKNNKNHHFERLCNLLKDLLFAASIVPGGSIDEKKLFIEPTILLHPPLDAEIMTEEIFGPLLPVITLTKIQETIQHPTTFLQRNVIFFKPNNLGISLNGIQVDVLWRSQYSWEALYQDENLGRVLQR